MEPKQSNFSGFLDGYRAGNLASFSSLFRFKKFEIKELSENITKDLEVELSPQKSDFLAGLKSLTSILLSSADTYEVLYSFGEFLRPLIFSYKKLDNETIVLIESKFKKIVYNFIELAKKSEIEKLFDLAIEIGESF
jgi:hypothetical protein